MSDPTTDAVTALLKMRDHYEARIAALEAEIRDLVGRQAARAAQEIAGLRLEILQLRLRLDGQPPMRPFWPYPEEDVDAL